MCLYSWQSESTRLKVAALNLYHPTASPLFCEAAGEKGRVRGQWIPGILCRGRIYAFLTGVATETKAAGKSREERD